MRTLSIVALSTVAFAHIALAADLPSKAPIAPAAVGPNWTGFYLGLNLGYGWSPDRAAVISGNTPGSQNLLDFSPGVNPFGLKSNGALGGFQFGYNWQFAPSWVLGFETDLQVSDLKGSVSKGYVIAGTFPFSSVVEQQINWFGTVRGRLGFLITPNWLAYGTGGLAYGRVEQSYASVNNSGVVVIGIPGLSCPANSVCTFGSNTERAGWTAGGGFEVLPNFRIFNSVTTVKLEYLYVNFGSQNVISTAIATPAHSYTAAFDDAVLHVIRAGVNVKF